jgi:hypothetical protein
MEMDKLHQLCKYIYDSSVMSYNMKTNPTKQILNIKEMVRTYIRTEVTPCELTDQEKLSYILDNELKITEAVMNGHQASNGDEYQETRVKIKQYRIELGLIKK